MTYGVFLRPKDKILILGASGKLGKALKKNKYFKKAETPDRKKLNILNKKQIRSFLKKKFKIVINCAAISEVKKCELNPKLAYKVNVIGVKNLVDEIKIFNKKNNYKILLIHLSSDAVYSPNNGNNKELSPLNPYNNYGKTKLKSEKIVNKLGNYLIVRTRFFDKKKIKFKDAAIDIFSSMLEVKYIVTNLIFLIKIGFKGIINVGGPKISDYEAIKRYKKNIKKIKAIDILKNLNYKIATNASLNISLLKKLKKKYEKA